MMTFDGLKPRILQLLGDPNGLRYTDDQIAEACRQALSDYDHFAPVLFTLLITVAESGRRVPLPGSAGFLSVRRVVFPYADENSPPTDRFYWYWQDGAPCLEFNGAAVPRAGERIQVTCAVRNRLYGLDGAEETTLPAEHDTLFIRGAAGYAMLMRAVAIAETINPRPSQSRLLDKSFNLIHEYKMQLAAVARSAHTPPAPYPASGWED